MLKKECNINQAKYVILLFTFQPSLVGSCGVPLKSILKSDSLCVSRNIEMREGNRNTSLSGSFKGNPSGLFGYLKVNLLDCSHVHLTKKIYCNNCLSFELKNFHVILCPQYDKNHYLNGTSNSFCSNLFWTH